MKRILILLMALLPLVSFAQDQDYALQPQTVACKDTIRVLCIGNSFTYFFNTENMLTEIAWSMGHCIKVRTAMPGGYSFGKHLADPKTYNQIEDTNNPYHVVFLQNQSQMNALYGRNPKQYKMAMKDACELSERVKEFSPKAKIFFEATWANPISSIGFSSFEEFDQHMWKGTSKMAKKCGGTVSPIGKAFALVRSRHPEINLLFADRHHQSKEGAYLKACVNYLMIYGGDFSEATSTCSLPKEVAKKLQTAAKEIVK